MAERADLAALKKLVASAGGLEEKDFTSDSYKDLKDAMDAAKDVIESRIERMTITAKKRINLFIFIKCTSYYSYCIDKITSFNDAISVGALI